MNLQEEVRRNRRVLDQQLGELKSLSTRGKQLKEEIEDLKELTSSLEKVVGVLNTIGEERQDTAQRQIEGLVTRGLQVIFGESLSFHVVSTTKGNTANTDFIVRTHLEDGSFVDTPVLESRGGGLASVVGFLLRVVVMLLSSNRQRKILFLDESFAAVSEEYEGRLAEFIRELVDKTDIQIVLVTHSSAYSDAADVVYSFKENNGKTEVEQV